MLYVWYCAREREKHLILSSLSTEENGDITDQMWLRLLLYASTMLCFPHIHILLLEREDRIRCFSLSLARWVKFHAICSVYLYYVYAQH